MGNYKRTLKEKRLLQYNLKCGTSLTLNIQCSHIKFCLHTKLVLSFATRDQAFRRLEQYQHLKYLQKKNSSSRLKKNKQINNKKKWRKSSQKPTLRPLSHFKKCVSLQRDLFSLKRDSRGSLSSEWSRYSETTVLVLKNSSPSVFLLSFVCQGFSSHFFSLLCALSLTCFQDLQSLPLLFLLISSITPLSSSHGYSIFLCLYGWFG